jgi:pimeloyl-ACP methyl ester carboxylesterase
MAIVACAALPLIGVTSPAQTAIGRPPLGFSSATSRGLHYVRGGHGPAVVLLHGFPEDWTEYRAVMPRLAQAFTVVAVDLPGIGRSAPAVGGYDAANLAGVIHAAVRDLQLERPYIVGHDLGGIVTYAYVRRFPDSIRGAMILDVPVPGVAGWDEAVANFWHIGFIQAPGELAEKLVVGRQAAFLGFSLDIGRFTPAQRAYYIGAYGAPQLHGAFEIYRGFPKNAAFNAGQTGPNPTPLVVAVGEKSFFASFLRTFVDGYRALGMARVDSASIPNASHYVLADNPDAVATLVERHAGDVK